MEKFFSILGKFFVAAGIIGILIGGGYYLGTKLNKPSQSTQSSTTSIAPTNTPPANAPKIVSPTSTTATGRFAVAAGGASATSFAAAKYMLSGVAGWILTKTEQPGMNKIVLTKGDYQLSIYQGAFGGGGCTFPGDQPQDMSTVLSTPVAQIPLLDGTILKRGQTNSANNPGKATFDVCQKQGNTYGMPTYFGMITYIIPLNPDASVLAEMDAMIGSLQKQ